MQWFKLKRSNGWTATRSTDQRTYIVRVQKRANAKPLITLAASEKQSIKNDLDLKPLVKKYQLAQSNVSFLLDTRDYQLVQLEKPKVPDTELKDAVRWQLKDSINFPVEDATIGTIKIPRKLGCRQPKHKRDTCQQTHPEAIHTWVR